jgi:hypothetical protein
LKKKERLLKYFLLLSTTIPNYSKANITQESYDNGIKEINKNELNFFINQDKYQELSYRLKSSINPDNSFDFNSDFDLEISKMISDKELKRLSLEIRNLVTFNNTIDKELLKFKSIELKKYFEDNYPNINLSIKRNQPDIISQNEFTISESDSDSIAAHVVAATEAVVTAAVWANVAAVTNVAAAAVAVAVVAVV